MSNKQYKSHIQAIDNGRKLAGLEPFITHWYDHSRYIYVYIGNHERE